LDARAGERALELGVVLGGDVAVGARREREDRAVDLVDAIDRTRRAVASSARAPVEADRGGEAVSGRGCEPRLTAAHAEADGEDRRAAESAQVSHGTARIELDLFSGHRIDMRHVLEVVALLRRS